MNTVKGRLQRSWLVHGSVWSCALLLAMGTVAAAGAPKAVVFAPGIISLPERIEFCMAMSPNEQVIFFTVRKAPGQWEIHQARFHEGAWQPSMVAPFSGEFSDTEPSLSPDGLRLFFSSNRPMQAGGEPADYNIWIVERTDRGWTTPWALPEPLNGPGHQWRASQSRSGTLYYSSQGLWRFSMKGDSVQLPVKLFDPQKPGSLLGGHAFVAPDESYLLTAWVDGPGGKGGWDIYVSFRDRQGNWGPSINLGDAVNTDAGEDFPTVSPRGRDLYFFRFRQDGGGESGDIYRIDASVIDALKPKPGSK
jgi:hypothetical protein